MRQGLTLTKKERNETQKAISKLDQSYQQGRVNPMVYRSQRGKLLANLKRPMAERTPINLNQESWFKRSEVHRGPAPVGYWDSSPISQGSVRRRVSSNKIRASLIDISNNGYWNSQDFQNALQTASAANQKATENNASYFQQAVMKSSQLGSAQSTLSEAGIWESIQESAPVTKALLRLESTINYTVQRMYAVGVSKEEAKAAIRQVAISSGQAMTSQGYSKENAAEIIALVVRGELGVAGAISRVSSDLNNVAENISALNHGTNAANPSAADQYEASWNNGFNIHGDAYVANQSHANQYAASWNNGFNIHGNGTPTGTSLSALMQAKNQLEQKFDLSNNPVERNQLSQSISQIEIALNQRQQGMNNSGNMASRKPKSSTTGPVTASYNPRNNLLANQSTMQQTSAALNRGGPSIMTVVKDLFTIDSNIYLDWTAGLPISVLSDGTFETPTNNSDPSSVFPSGEWTVFASNNNSIPTLKSIINSIGYALGSPLWGVNDRAYLIYLKQSVVSRIAALESSGVTYLSPAQQNANAAAQQQAQNALLQQNSPAVGGHNHYKLVNGNSIEIITAEANNMLPVNYHQNLHNKGYSNNQPSFNYWESNNLVTAEQAKAAQQNANAAAQKQAQQNANAAAAAQQQAQKNANNAAAAAAQKQAQQNANAAAQKQAQQNANAAAQQQNLPLKIINRGGLWKGGGRPGGFFTSGIGGSTSNTTSTRSHGGARFTQDPRANYRN